ncbi:MAG: site-specific integrase [Thermoplasmatales archaeon]
MIDVLQYYKPKYDIRQIKGVLLVPGYIKMIPKGYYRVTVEAGRDPATGNRKRVVRYVHGREAEAKDLLAKLMAEINSDTYLKPNKITVAQWLDTWLREYKSIDLRQTSLESYTQMINTHVVPSIGAMPLQALRPEHLQALYQRKLLQEGKSARTVQYLHRIINGALKQAVASKLLATNPNAATRPPAVKRPEPNTLPPDDFNSFLSVLEGERLRAAYITLLGTGLRRGEVLGLRRMDIDLHQKIIHVRQQVVKTNHGTAIVLPKTDKSRRAIPIPGLVAQVLAQHMEKMDRNGACSPDSLVFPSLAGTPIHPRNFHRKYKQLLHRAGLPNLRLHDLRHTYATRLLELGEDIRVIQELLGHSSYNLTANTYSHVGQTLKVRAVTKLDEFFGTGFGTGHQSGTNSQKQKAPDPGSP